MVFQSINWAYTVSGLLVGALVGVTGVGGGSLMTPILVLLFGVDPTTAVGTDLLFACLTKTTGVAVHGFNNTIDWRIVRRLALGSVPATAATILLLAHLGKSGHHRHDLVTTVLGVALVLTALALIFRQQILARLAPLVDKLDDSQRFGLTVVLGVLLGVFVSISSVGAGAIGVTVLLVLYPGLPLVRVVGSDIAHAVPLTLVAGLGHWLLGTINLSVLLSLLIGSIPGIVITSSFAYKIPERILRPLLAATLAIVGLRLAI